MKKLFLFLNLLISIAVFIGNYFYLTAGGILLKALCSGGFVLMGLCNLAYALLNERHGLRFSLLMASGLLLSMLGDIFLGPSFIAGASLFALGHLCYLVAYCQLLPFARRDLFLSLLLFGCVSLLLLFAPWFSFPDALRKGVSLGYACIISLMTGKALSNLTRRPSPMALVLFLGSALFFLSDFMLALEWFSPFGWWAGKVCMAAYYPAQCLLAFSSFCYGTHPKEVSP